MSEFHEHVGGRVGQLDEDEDTGDIVEEDLRAYPQGHPYGSAVVELLRAGEEVYVEAMVQRNPDLRISLARLNKALMPFRSSVVSLRRTS